MIFDQNIPFGHRPMHTAANALAPLLDTYLACRSSKSIGAGIDRIGQNIVHDVVGGQSPDDVARVAIARLHWQLNACSAQPEIYLTNTLELGQPSKDELQCILHSLVAA